MSKRKRNNVEGRVYRFRSLKECQELQITLPPAITEIVRCHMVLVLDWVPLRKGYVKVMTITSKNQNGEFLPIAPTPKKPYPVQLKFINPLPEFNYSGKLMYFTKLPEQSYLKVDVSYEVPLRVLEEVLDDGNQFMLRLKKQGGIRQLRHHLHDQERLALQEVYLLLSENGQDKDGTATKGMQEVKEGDKGEREHCEA